MPEPYRPGTYLGFDYGEKYIGIAVGQSISKSASALDIIKGNNEQVWQHISKLIDEWQPVGIVVGVPETADGKTGKIHNLIDNFTAQLKTRFNINVYSVNETLSSHAARDLLSTSTKRTIPRLDDMAAAVILQTWFDEHL
jgi:putative Holliday junction resolvase